MNIGADIKDLKFKPFTDNLIFFDTEFTGNNPALDEIISIGMVKMDGSELYLELESNIPASNWIKENVLPSLKNTKVSKEVAIEEINKFIGNNKPYLISNRSAFDTAYLYKIYKFHTAPFQEFTIDFSNILFLYGFDPKFFGGDNKIKFCEVLGVDITKYKIHNALDDARLLREVYLKIIV